MGVAKPIGNSGECSITVGWRCMEHLRSVPDEWGLCPIGGTDCTMTPCALVPLAGCDTCGGSGLADDDGAGPDSGYWALGVCGDCWGGWVPKHGSIVTPDENDMWSTREGALGFPPGERVMIVMLGRMG